MNWYKQFVSNHVLANLVFVLVLTLGAFAFVSMPRERDPEVNFNWVYVITPMAGASAEDVEKRITDPLEDAIERAVDDIDFVQSSSTEGVSTMLIRFEQIDERTFDKRMTDLRREVQNTYTDELPVEADDPVVKEITSSSGLPAATVVISGLGEGNNLQEQARNVKKDIERLRGVDEADVIGLPDPELHVRYIPEKLEGLGVSPADLTDTVRGYFRDVSAGDLITDTGRWVVRISGTDADPAMLADYPVVTAQGVIPLGSLAELSRETKEVSELVRFNGKPAIIFFITKKVGANVIDLVDELKGYIDIRNKTSVSTGTQLHLVDDQTISTRKALSIMSSNALIGLAFVVLVTLAFLGTKVALLTSIGIPFTLAGTFLVLYINGMTLNNSVLLGIVIALGMLVDDAVVVVESIYQQLRSGVDAATASVNALKEVFAPVTTSVLTTMAVFLPLTLLPGIVGEFMKVIPIVVIIGLAISLLEAYWMLPAHIMGAKIKVNENDRWQKRRSIFTHWIRLRYTRLLIFVMRRPKRFLSGAAVFFMAAVLAFPTGFVRFNFFAADSLGLFYVTVHMPAGSSLEKTSQATLAIEKQILAQIPKEKIRASIAYSGYALSETEYIYGETIGQIMVSLYEGGAVADKIVAKLNQHLDYPEADQVVLFHLKDGPPVTKAISARLIGDDHQELRRAADELKRRVAEIPHIYNVGLDYRPGNPQIKMTYNGEAIQRSQVNPTVLSRTIQSYVDGEIAASFQDGGEEVLVRVIAKQGNLVDIDELLRQSIATPFGSVPMAELVNAEYGFGQQAIRHYNFRRAVTLDADIEDEHIDAVQANAQVEAVWAEMKNDYPNVSIDFSGMLDDINESLDSMKMLFILGLGLIYIILGTQFRSYWQPLLVLVAVPLAFTGVVAGLLITGNPLSLFTLYGIVALAGIAVNAAIVLISAANDRVASGMSVLHATVYAARRRVLPIMITSLTTIAGLSGLAIGLGGKSLVWGPVATAIVSGLMFSTLLALLVIPLLYRIAMQPRGKKAKAKTI